MKIPVLGIRALWIALVGLLLSLVAVPSASADPKPVFSLGVTTTRPGYPVEIIPGDPCPVTPGGTTKVIFRFWDAANVSVTMTSIDVDQSTGEWQSGKYLPGFLNVAQGPGTLDAWCSFETYHIPASYEPVTLTVAGSAPKFNITKKLSRGEWLYMESVDTCSSNNSVLWPAIYDASTGHQYPLSASTALESNGSWKFKWKIPTSMPLGQYRVSPRCHGANESADIYYGAQIIDVVEPAKYVALGDSYSWGEGTYNYFDTGNNCHRSPDSYVFHVAEERGLGTPNFAACSGARTWDYLDENPKNGLEAAQYTHLSSATEVVTLTMGGNDAGFKTVASSCARSPINTGWGCRNDTSVVDPLNERLGALAGTGFTYGDDDRPIESLKNLYRDIALNAPNAKVYVAGYPELFGDDASDFDSNSQAPSGKICTLSVGVTIDFDDAQWLNAKAVELNTIISDAVDEARGEGVDVRYVPAALFSGHGLCDSAEPWITPVTLPGPEVEWPPEPLPESLHPTVTGQTQGYGAAFVSVMNYYD